MKHSLLKSIALLAVIFSASFLQAHDFAAVNENGKYIYYNIISETEKTCEVTYMGTSYNSNTYSGEVRIPETVTFNSNVYTVTSIGEKAFYNISTLKKVITKNINRFW